MPNLVKRLLLSTAGVGDDTVSFQTAEYFNWIQGSSRTLTSLGATVNGAARAKGESFTLTANTNATVRFSGGTVGLVQLEPGTVATPFEHRPYGAELALCQRYYEKGTFTTTGVTQGGFPSANILLFKVSMRAV